MSSLILTINAGSSSVKVSLYKLKPHCPPSPLADAQVSHLTSPPPKLSYTRGSSHTHTQTLSAAEVSSQEAAFATIFQHMVSDPELPELESEKDVAFACHRVVHGGLYDGPRVLDEETRREIEEWSRLAPLHNRPALRILAHTTPLLKHAIQTAHFDSAFHQTLPAAAHAYFLPAGLRTREHLPLRKYGFHGLSHGFVLAATARRLGRAPGRTSLVSLHLGSGCSACAVRRGRSVDTSMGLTPLAGLPGATRAGDVDPSAVFHCALGEEGAGQGKLGLDRAEEFLNLHSGWAAVAGTADFAQITARRREDERCGLAFDMFVDRIVGVVGSYFAKLGGEVDALVFAGGVGEGAIELREAVGRSVECLGFALDEEKNRNVRLRGETVVDVSRDGAAKKVMVCRTDEGLAMADQCASMAETLRESKR